MKPYFDSLCGPFEVDWEDHNRLNRWQEDEFELGDRVATALMGGYLVGFDTDKILGRLRVKQVIRGLKSVTITPLDADGRPNGEPKTLDLKSTVRLHPRANPIDVYLSTLEIQ